jgi:hypothetical protein
VAIGYIGHSNSVIQSKLIIFLPFSLKCPKIFLHLSNTKPNSPQTKAIQNEQVTPNPAEQTQPFPIDSFVLGGGEQGGHTKIGRLFEDK